MVIEHFFLSENGWVPNHAHLPVIACRSVVPDEGGDLATTFERTFARNHWQGIWRNGIFDYHHYHTMAHEVLGIARGHGVVMLGGPGGREVEVSAGDCLILPAGTGHCRISASEDFLVVGGYPPGQDPDLRREAPGEAGLHIIATLPLPETDPLGGDAVSKLWQNGG